MSPWWQDLPGVTGTAPLSPAALAGWPDRAMEDRLARLSFCPVALSELYAIAQHLPLVVRETPEGPELAADLRRETLQRPAFDEGGRLTLPYRPVALRQLPFTVDAAGRILRLTDSEAAPDVARPVDLQKRLVGILAAQVEGRQRMTRALAAAIAAGLVARPAGSNDGAPQEVTPRANEDRIDDCTDPLALRLAAVMLYALKNRRQSTALLSPGARARLSLVRDDPLRDRPFLSDDDAIDFSRLQGG